MTVLESTSGSTSTTYTYSGSTANSIAFSNDGANDATLVIQGHTIVVKPGEVFESRFTTPITEVDITINGDYRMLLGD